MTDNKRYTSEELQGLSNGELDVTVAKVKGARIEESDSGWHLFLPDHKQASLSLKKKYIDSEEEAWEYALTNSHVKYLFRYSTDANAALLLLDEIVEGERVFADFLSTFSEVGYNLNAEFERVKSSGKPSVALPSAITIAYILHKQGQQ